MSIMKTQSGTLWLCLRFYLFILIKVELIYKAVLVSMSPSKNFHNKHYEKLTWNNTNKTLCAMSLPNWGMIYDFTANFNIKQDRTKSSLHGDFTNNWCQILFDTFPYYFAI